eukprot:GHVU01198709.1.p1 GENE.GHVU01198709.1~~GHVU01198709.1.p1  ORF type:complete len:835 (-),score=112.71 GHVU01198709.1:1311-3815(-)
MALSGSQRNPKRHAHNRLEEEAEALALALDVDYGRAACNQAVEGDISGTTGYENPVATAGVDDDKDGQEEEAADRSLGQERCSQPEDRQGAHAETSLETDEDTQRALAIDELLTEGGEYETYDKAREAIIKFQHQTESKLKDRGGINARTEKGSTSFRCRAVAGCRVAVYAKLELGGKTTVTVADDMKHHHELMPPQRIAGLEKETFMAGYRRRVDDEKYPRQQAYSKTNLRHHEKFSSSYTTRNISRISRRSELQLGTQQLQELAGNMHAYLPEGVGAAEYVRVQAEEAPLNSAAVLGRLSMLRERDPGSYVWVEVDKHGVITLMVICTSSMRRNGSLFGSQWFVDDAHKASKSQYKVPCVTVMTHNGAAVAAAVGFFAHGNNSSWTTFVKHAYDAFMTVSGGPVRPLAVVIADQDGCILHALSALGWAEQLGVTMWKCWFHWKRNLLSTFPRLKDALKRACVVLEKLLQTDEWWAYEALQTQAREMLAGLPTGDGKKVGAREYVARFLDEVVESRVLGKVKFFSNGYSSQSPAESINAVWRLNGVTAGREMGLVVDAVVDRCENQGLLHAEQERKWGKVDSKPLTEETARVLTPNAYNKLFVPQWELSRTMTVYSIGNIFEVREPGASATQRHIVTMGTDMACTCNYRTYKGMICSHLIKVIEVTNGGEYRHLPGMFNDRWLREQPIPQFKHGSPELPSPAEVNDVGVTVMLPGREHETYQEAEHQRVQVAPQSAADGGKGAGHVVIQRMETPCEARVPAGSRDVAEVRQVVSSALDRMKGNGEAVQRLLDFTLQLEKEMTPAPPGAKVRLQSAVPSGGAAQVRMYTTYAFT